MAVSLRDKLRAKTVGKKKEFKKEIREFDGEKFEVRQPSVSQRGAILQAAKVQSGDVEKMDLAKLQVWATICCTYTPEGEPVFEESDVESLLALESGSFVDDFSQAALKLMNVNAEEVGKNSEAILNDSSSTE